MAEKKNILTEEGLAKLEDELQDLKVFLTCFSMASPAVT